MVRKLARFSGYAIGCCGEICGTWRTAVAAVWKACFEPVNC